ncbi:MAG TPA: LAGLIDADG family homing endonuclease, partial [Woeseiaceae bacterium]
QGRPDSNLGYYIAGFVDGEGSFHVAIQKNSSVKLKWQLVPEFHVSQHVSSRNVLDLMKITFGCGYVKPNHRANPDDETYAYVVRSREDLATKVIPFFREFGLRTSKKNDFEIFSTIVSEMQKGEHRTREGFVKLLKLAFSMNRSGKYRRMSLDEIQLNLEPSETVRQTSYP